MSHHQTFVKTEKIRFQHCDPAGIVFYPRFLEMVNQLVEDWFEEALELPFVQLHTEAAIPTVSLNIQFRNAARLGDLITKHLFVSKISRTSLVYTVQFLREQTTILHGEVTLVYVRYNEAHTDIQSAPWPDNLRAAIAPYCLPQKEV